MDICNDTFVLKQGTKSRENSTFEFSKKIACVLGIKEAIILQEIDNLSQKYVKGEGGKAWITNTHQGWSEHFPFFSARTTRRILKKLRNLKILMAETLNGKTLWYSIDYDMLEKIIKEAR